MSDPGESQNFEPCYHFSNTSFGRGRSPEPLVFNCVLNGTLCLVALLGNTMILSALRHASSIYRPSKMLLYSLVISDLCVGIVVHPVYITFLMSKLRSWPQTFCQSGIILFLASSMSNSTSFLSIVALSLDRYAAFHLHASYKSAVTVKRMALVVAFIWAFSLFWSTTILWSQQAYYGIAGVMLVLFIPCTAVAYLKIYHGLRQRGKVRARSLSDVMRYRRTVSNSLWLYCVLLSCYLPYLCIAGVAATTDMSPVKILILEFASTLVFMNSSLNPFVYCWRIAEVRTAAQATLLQPLQCWKEKDSRELWGDGKEHAKQRKNTQESLSLGLDTLTFVSYRPETSNTEQSLTNEATVQQNTESPSVTIG